MRFRVLPCTWLVASAALAGLAKQALVDLVVAEVGAALSTIYSGVTWLVDNADKLGKSVGQWTDVLGAIRVLANAGGPAATAAARAALAGKVKGLLDGLIVPAVSFGASQLGLADLPGKVRGTLAGLQAAPRQKVTAALKKLADRARRWPASSPASGSSTGWSGRSSRSRWGGRLTSCGSRTRAARPF